MSGTEAGVKSELARSGTQIPLSLCGKEVSGGLGVDGSRWGVPGERRTGSHGRPRPRPCPGIGTASDANSGAARREGAPTTVSATQS